MSGCGGCSYKGMSTAVETAYVGVRFGEETNLTLCGTGGELLGRGAGVIVEVEGEPSYGRVEQSPMPIFKPCQKASAKTILRPATTDDTQAFEAKLERERMAKLFCLERVRALKLEMKISKVEFALSGKKATLHFTAEHRIDFRQLVRDLSQRFAARIQMVQVGSRDEAALLGGVGVCGQTLCCSTWLKDFRPISIQMAKRQNLSLNPSKISGQCGRLLCCLAYEDDQYKGAKRPKDAPIGDGSRMSQRKLIRPDISDKRGTEPRAVTRRKLSPPEQTNAEEFYYLKQMSARTPMVVVLTNDEELRGWIEWYDKGAIKLNRAAGPNLLIPKHNIRYLFKEEELRRSRRRTSETSESGSPPGQRGPIPEEAGLPETEPESEE